MTAFAFPFRFHHGKIATVEENSDEFAAQRIMSVIKTEQGELPLNPTFGIQSLEFQQFDKGNFLLAVNSNYNDIAIDDIAVINDNSGEVKINVNFTRKEV
jgi:hypothetical protein